MSIRTNLSQVRRGLKTIETAAIRGAEGGLADRCPAVAQALRDTDAHGDQTGATRAGYTAGVVGRTVDSLAPALTRARFEVERRNPGHSAVVGATSRRDTEAVVILTSPTDYQIELSGDNAGAKDALGPTLTREARGLAEAAADGVRRALR